jgi:uncharacterized protein
VSIRPLTPDDYSWVLALNATSETETSPLDEAKLARMVGAAFSATAYGDAAFLIAFDQSAAYDGQHFGWFRAWFPKFVYVDRIVVSGDARGHGIARALYEHLFAAAREAGHDRVGCEVNLMPPNRGSDLFHAKMNFEEVGQSVPFEGKCVRYCMHWLVEKPDRSWGR